MMNKWTRSLVYTLLSLCLPVATLAQEDQAADAAIIKALTERVEALEKGSLKLKKLTVTGHFQGQYIYAEQDAQLRIGAPNENPDHSFSRIGIRQGRMRFLFEDGIVSAFFQLDMTERGVAVVDAYGQLRDPWMRSNFLRGGMFFRPFGHEVRFPTALRETPERSRIITTLFPGARDLGVMMHLQADKSLPISMLELDLGLLTGNGMNAETDSKRDFVGSLALTPPLGEWWNVRVGTSYYSGSVYQGTPVIYRMEGSGFVRDAASENQGRFARRKYIGFDAQTTCYTGIGRSQVKAEFIFGKQPGSSTSSISPNSSNRPSHNTYLRNFQGGYVTFLQDLGRIPFTLFGRYDWYDPNRKVSGDDIGLNNTTVADVRYGTMGVGLMWRALENLEFSGFYEFVSNETTANIEGFGSNRKDNMFTFTMMFRY